MEVKIEYLVSVFYRMSPKKEPGLRSRGAEGYARSEERRRMASHSFRCLSFVSSISEPGAFTAMSDGARPTKLRVLVHVISPSGAREGQKGTRQLN